MNILAVILILGASGSAERSMTTEASIGRIVASVAWGAVSDVFSHRDSVNVRPSPTAMGRLVREADPTLRIDGIERTGWRAWAEAGIRVARYVANETSETDRRGHRGDGEVERISGSVGYSYRLDVRGYGLRRETRITDGHVLLTTDAWWVETVQVTRRISRRIPIHVQISIRADETDSRSTRIVGAATGTADTRDFRCGIVRRIAEQRAADTLRTELDRTLVGIQRRGTYYYHGADEISGILDGIGSGIRAIGKVRR